MDEQLQTALAHFISGAMQAFKEGKDFAVAQLPDVIQQLLIWKFWESLVVMLVPLVIALSLLRFWCGTVSVLKRVGELSGQVDAAYAIYDATSVSSDNFRSAKTAYAEARAAKNAYVTGGWLQMRVWLAVVSAVALIMWLLLAVNLTWLKIMVAPKIYLIEYAATLVGSVK